MKYERKVSKLAGKEVTNDGDYCSGGYLDMIFKRIPFQHAVGIPRCQQNSSLTQDICNPHYVYSPKTEIRYPEQVRASLPVNDDGSRHVVIMTHPAISDPPPGKSPTRRTNSGPPRAAAGVSEDEARFVSPPLLHPCHLIRELFLLCVAVIAGRNTCSLSLKFYAEESEHLGEVIGC